MTQHSTEPAPSEPAVITAGSAERVLATISGNAEPGAEPGDHVLLRSSVHRKGGRVPRTVIDEDALFAALEDVYDLGRWRTRRRTESGASNTSWFVGTDAGDVVLRRSHTLKTVAGAEFECALIDHLLGNGYPAPPVVRTRDGAILVQLDGVIHMVMRLLPGGVYDEHDPAHLVAAARGLGRYHAIVSELSVPAEQGRSVSLAALGRLGQESLWSAVEVVAPLLSPDGAAALREDARTMADQMARLDGELGQRQEHLTSLVIHGSYGQTALLMSGAELTGVIDYDRAAHDLLGLDLAYALKAFCRVSKVGHSWVGIDADKCRTFLDHYRSQAPVAEEDLAAMPAFFQAQRVLKIAKKCDNLLTKQAVVPRHARDAENFAGILSRECDRVRWITDTAFTLTENA